MFNASMILHKYFYLHEVLQIFSEGHRLLQPIPLTHNDTQTKTRTHTHIERAHTYFTNTITIYQVAMLMAFMLKKKSFELSKRCMLSPFLQDVIHN